MLNQRDLLKEAIADAKAVKETAIANAKSVLEETFTPHLKSMLSAKLEEMEQEEEIDENLNTEEQDVDMEEMNLDELLSTLNESEDEESEDEEEVEEEEVGDVEEEEIDLENMTEEDLTKYIESVISDMVEAGELEPGESSEEDDMEIDIENIEDDEDELEENLRPGYGVKDFGPMEDNPLGKAMLTIAKAAKKAGMSVADFVRQQSKEDSLDEYKEDKESEEQLDELRKELKEVNLLNAKLLYANKIYTSKNLSESKKLNVLKAFDKAETVKEAKIVYESLNGSLDVKSKSRSNINEIKSMASKTIQSPNRKQPIVENQTFKRFQELAGLI